jgi:hypothetical protein
MKRLIYAALAASLMLAQSTRAQTIRDNEFLFSVPNLNQGYEFDLKQYEVTTGQPWGGVSTSIDTAKHYAWLYVKSGRKGSYDVGFWFRAQVGAGHALGWTNSSQTKLPTDLNFAIRGDLHMKAGGIAVLCKNVVIGQGHTFPFNNWWVGGPNMKLENVNGREMLVQQCEGGWIRTAVGGYPQNNFDVYVMAYDKH